MKRLLQSKTGIWTLALALAGAGCGTQGGGDGADFEQILGAVTSPSGNSGQTDAQSGDPSSGGATTGGASQAQTEPLPAMPASGLAVLKLNAASSTRTAVSYDQSAKIPTSVQTNVPVPDTSSTDAVAMSLSYFDAYKDLYQFIEPASQLFPIRFAEDTDGQHVFFGQQRDGLVVYGAEIAIHLSGERVVGTNGRYIPDVPIVKTPSIDAAGAQEIAAAAAGTDATGAEGVPTQVFFNESLIGGVDHGTHQAWRVGVRGNCGAPGGCALQQYFIDAFTGDVLWTLDLTHTCDKDFDIETVNETESTTCWGRLFETDDDQWFDEDGLDCGIFNCPDADAEGYNTYNFAHKTYDYYAGTFGRCGWDGNDDTLQAMIHAVLRDSAGAVALNAKYDNGCNHLVFSTGMVTLDIFAHEFTHAVTRYSSNLVYANQSGALNESYSDVFGAMVNGGWLIGQGCALGTLRDMSNPPAFGDPDKFTNYVVTASDNGGVHTNSGIPNKAAFLIADGGNFNGVTVYGIGRAKLQQLYYTVLTSRLTSNSQFIDARNASVAVAREWALGGNKFGFTLSNVTSVIRAWNAVGVGAPDTDGDGYDDNEDADDDGDHIPDNVDNCRTVANPYQEDTDRDGMGDACDTDIDNDGVMNSVDNCVFQANRDQADADGDGVGDVCDNCPNSVDIYPRPDGTIRRVANPDQTDTDHDGMGDVCDSDDDGDGVIDLVDNCPVDFNPEQADLNKNGVGLACDKDEQAIFTQPAQPDPRGWWKIKLCAGGCPGWLTREWESQIQVELPWSAAVQIVDQYGVVARRPAGFEYNDAENKVWSFNFRPETSVRYVFPAGATKFVGNLSRENGLAVLESTQYFLRIVGDDGNHNETYVDPYSINVGPLQQR